MAQNRPTRLQEAEQTPVDAAQVIDVSYKVVKSPARRVASFGRWALAFAAAATIGFLAPPVWVALQHIAATLNGL